MLIVMQTTGLVAAAIFFASASPKPRGSLSLSVFSRRVSRFFWLAGEVTMTSRKGFPISVGPMSMTFTAPPPCFSSRR